MVQFDEIFERIQLATGKKTQVDLAAVLDIRQSSISDAKRRNSVPAEWYMKLFEHFGLSPDWLKKGTGPMYLRTEQGYEAVDAPAEMSFCEESSRYGNSDAKNSVLPVYTAGDFPRLGEQTAAATRISVPQSFAGNGIMVLRAESSAMDPAILKNAFVGINTQARVVASGEVYAVRLDYEGIVLKRIFIDAQHERILLRSDNPKHPETILPIEGYEDRIVGRVEWVLQRL